MKYAVLADTHLGSGTEREDIGDVMQSLRDEGYTLVLNGDVFDLWRDKEAYEKYRHLLHESDILIVGNHDFGLEGVDARRYLDIEVGGQRYFITHGDVVDFVYGFAQLENARQNGEGSLLVRLTALLRPWDTEDVFDFYLSMRDAPAWAVSAVEHGTEHWLKRVQALVLLGLLAFTRFPREWPRMFLHKPLLDAPIITKSTYQLYTRVCGFFPQAFQADTVIIGHMHLRRDEPPIPGKRLVVLDSWMQGSTPTVALIGEGGCTLRSY